jgi:hypothetical protein
MMYEKDVCLGDSQQEVADRAATEEGGVPGKK